MKTFIVVAVLLTFSAACMAADMTVLERREYISGVEGHTLALSTKYVDFNAYNFNLAKADYEVGKEVPTGVRGLKAGGFLAYLPKGRNYFLLPSACYTVPALGGMFSAHVGYYAPLNGGTAQLYSREVSLLYKTDKVETGPCFAFSQPEGKAAKFQFGAVIRAKLGNTILKARFLPAQENQPAKLRVETCVSF